jgi:hypothetical protein
VTKLHTIRRGTFKREKSILQVRSVSRSDIFDELRDAAGRTGTARFKPVDLNLMVRSGEYLQKVNNFLVILDASGTIQGAEFNTAKEVIKRMILTNPDLRLKSGLRSYGFTLGEQTSSPSERGQEVNS